LKVSFINIKKLDNLSKEELENQRFSACQNSNEF